MDRKQIALQLTDYLKTLTAEDNLTPATKLIDEGLVDSLTMMDLVSHIESEFQFRLGVEEFTPGNFESAESIATLVEQKMAARSGRDAA